MIEKRQGQWPLVMFVCCLLVPVGMVLWAIYNEEWDVIEDGMHPFDNVEQVYLPTGDYFQREEDLYWLGIDEWPSSEAFYYSPLFAGGMAALEALLPDHVISVGVFAGLLAVYILSTRLWNRELQAITGLVIGGVAPVFVYYSAESFWANIVPGNVVIGLYGLLALAVWAGRRHYTGVTAFTLVLIVITKPQFIFAALAALVLAWNDTGGRAFLRKTALAAAGLLIGMVALGAVFSSPAYIGEQLADWARFLSTASSDYPYVGSDEFFTSNNSLAQQLHRVGAEELLPLVFVVQGALLLDFFWRIVHALRQGLNWQQNPQRALAFVLWGYLLVGLLAHVFMDLIAGPVVLYFMIGAGLLRGRRMTMILAALLTILVVAPLMSYSGLFPCYLIFTIITLPPIRAFAIHDRDS